MKIFTKLILVFCLTIFTQNVNCQTNWQDDFTDNNLGSNPTWLGDTANFAVNTQQQMWLNAPATAGSATIYTTSTAAIDATWEFFVEFDFNPSANNFADVFLLSSTPSPNTQTNGYFVRIGGSSKDQLSLYKRTGNQDFLLAQSAEDYLDQNQVNVRVKVTRDAANNWQLQADSTGGTTYKFLGNATDSSHFTSNFFAVYCQFTSTRSDKFVFDDFNVSGFEYTDSIAPKISHHFFVNQNQIDLVFSEAIDSATATNTTNYNSQNSANPVLSATWQKGLPNAVKLTFVQPFTNAQQVELLVKNIADLYGNVLADTVVRDTFFMPDYRSVVFNEILPDPSPVVGMPDAEFIEIYNNTAHDILLENWQFVADKDTFVLPAQEIQANGYLLLLDEADAHFYDTLPHIAINASSGWLKNDGEKLILLDENNQLIDALNYSLDLHSNPIKKDGGWSLAQISPGLPCSETTNWSSSNNTSGGSPGKINRPETTYTPAKTALSYLIWEDLRHIDLVFTTAINATVANAISSSTPIANISLSTTHTNRAHVTFSADVTNVPTFLYVADTVSCTSHFLPDTVSFSVPMLVNPEDVIINEFLSNPKQGGTDYIELWNISDKTLLLNQLYFAQVDGGLNVTSNHQIATENVLFTPKTIQAFSTNTQQLAPFYNLQKPKHYFTVGALPNLPNDEGGFALTLADLTVLNALYYTADWQHPQINNPAGVALERIHPTLPANLASSWHSASSAVNYGTPGALNSQYSTTATNKENIWLNNNSISPNNDGRDDVLIVYYNLPQGCNLNVKVFATNGVLVHTIAQNYITQEKGQLTWEGRDSGGFVTTAGVYVIMAEWTTPEGERGVAKLTVAVNR